MAGQVLIKVSKDEEERARIMRDEKIELDYQSYMATATQQGLQQGLAQGLEQGLAQGHEKGLAQGYAESRQYFLNLLNQGLPVEEIKQQLESQQ